MTKETTVSSQNGGHFTSFTYTVYNWICYRRENQNRNVYHPDSAKKETKPLIEIYNERYSSGERGVMQNLLRTNQIEVLKTLAWKGWIKT